MLKGEWFRGRWWFKGEWMDGMVHAYGSRELEDA